MSAYEKSAKDTKSAATSGTTDPKLLRLFALYENLTRFVMPLSTVLTDRDFPATPITQSNNIVDISNVGLKQFWNLRTHMQNASQLATANYPETLDRIFIIGAPSFFPTVWGWIKRWFDPITTSKIFILSQAEMKSTLESFIEPANIPQKYGGELDFQWGDLPKYDAAALNEVIEWKNGHKDFPEGPMFWHDKGSYIELEACGSVDGKPRSEIVCTVRKTATEKEAEFEKRDQEDLALGRPPTRTGRSQGASLLKIPTLDDAANRKQAEDDAAGVKRPELETFYTAQEDLPTVNVQNSEGGAEGAKVDADAGAQRPLINSNPSQVSTIKEDLSGEHDQTHSAVVPGKEGRRHSVGSHKSIKSHKSFGSRKSQEVSKLGKMMNKLHFKKSPEEQ